MKNKAAQLLSLLGVALLVSAATAQDCPCTMSGSSKYAGMFVWDCSKLFLTDVPGGCFTIRSENVSEFLLSNNQVADIRSTSLAVLTDLIELYLDNNLLSFVDPTAFEFMRQLEIFNVNNNLELSLEHDTLSMLTKLREITTIGTKQLTWPNIANSPALEKLDMRSSQLTGLPLHGLVHPNMTYPSFFISLHGNEFPDVAASTLLELPDGCTLTLDTFVTIWARSDAEKQMILSKTWTVNIDLTAATKICEYDGLPLDVDICFA